MRGEELGAERVIDAVDVLDMGAGDHKHVRHVGGLSELVEEREKGSGLVDDMSRPMARNDLAEHAGLQADAGYRRT